MPALQLMLQTEFRISVVSIADDTEVITELLNGKGLWDSIVNEGLADALKPQESHLHVTVI